MTFLSREDAGRKLGIRLRQDGVQVDIVLGLPRGGVVVAAEVARELERPLDVFLVRKIGHPLQREFAIGALAEPDVVLFDESSLGGSGNLHEQVEAIVEEEKRRLQEYRARFHSNPAPELVDKHVLIVDDGLATGATAEAAVRGARHRGASRVIIAVPVASEESVARLRESADEVRVLVVDPRFEAVGQFYQDFEQTTDEQVIALLQAAAAK